MHRCRTIGMIQTEWISDEQPQKTLPAYHAIYIKLHVRTGRVYFLCLPPSAVPYSYLFHPGNLS